jgi:thioredoxin-like negative regulator of GroEL
MMPIVHGLERKYEGRIDFVYLHVGDPRTTTAREQLGYAATPQIMLLDASGQKVREWIGLVAEATLATGLDDLLRR